ncbi:MAG: dihydrolipoyl dehydrogenase [Firmicutes bacterium]|nr:dihydrolipoyl dehydrogenase [Bacillota bacterium]
MAEIIIMPKLGFNMNEGKLVQWYKAEGDSVAKGEPLFSVETDKTNMDIEATSDGVVRKLFIEEGETLPVTLPIAIVGGADEDIAADLADAQAQLAGAGVETEEAAPAAAAPAADAKAGAAEDTAAAGSAYDYDIAVIGGGPGGYVAAIKGAQLGKKVVIAEKENFGGTCLNVGCIPTKALLRSAESLKEVKESAAFGVIDVDVADAKLDLVKVQARKKKVVGQLVGGVQGLLGKNGVAVKNGEAVLKDAHTLEVGGETVTAENVIIATGSVSKGLPIEISDQMNVMTSTEALDLEKAPESIAIIGGGVIGIEFAYLLSSIGTQVTVVEFLDRILPMVDEEITQQVTAHLQEQGVTIYTSAKVTEITADGVKFEKDGAVNEVKVETVLMSVGRAPRLDGIDTEALGIKTERGAIVTDSRLQTSVPGVYAIGDVNGRVMLAHTASAEGLVAVKNICGEKAEMDYDKIPSAIYIQPEIASIGLTEAQAKEKYGKVNVGRFPMMANGKAKIQGEERGLVKVIAEPKYGEIVGVHLYCVHATDMIAEAAAAMKLEATPEEIAATVHPHPTVSEVVMEAMEAVTGKAIHC